ncbi:hypothetical protein A2526_00460 [candidate division WOR-1 bacterium RIFOXYD2_FULL_36_8]|uniref:Secretin/TonB short N-terminal domain-containing protein n=1 Tax=candidate division WOR-1 bacterium RIFOXYB2_FULL_36_35 TaxID=1802578 RepID=A0A1F4S5X8_UNCSA|nr:MAG: hypothetical protein A2230_02225 [candidate division WOR-1 bacterium RIFOXYA2_FULL_36_21]OGC15832.1 MAG: hypothetical protein A2290_05800 [candidate division WOR-1 bacterium RIFOXYB2_FULL_36_35]OGC15906.1 MAG: hypothetical protein A2282_04910 [candidate division WOR-1 bacterium RIFOXYA12_FULL_36_13]OGC41676.1 MAG: hypothetical protein A2526_00460 [candidate division WOR-1 bacterium RIFOXYD2_FULL_36_8]
MNKKIYLRIKDFIAAKSIRYVLINSILLFLFFSSAGFSQSEDTLGDVSIKGGLLSFKLKDADIKSILQIFARQLHKNIVAGDGVKGTVSLSFSDVKPLEGFEAVLRAKGLDWFEEGDTIVVSNKKTVKTFLLQYANAVEVKTALELLMVEGDQVSVNDSYNALIVKTPSDNMSRIERAIRNMDIPPIQVMVQVNIIEIKTGDVGNLGLNAKYSSQNNPNNKLQTKGFAEKGDTGSLGFYAQVISGNVESYLSTVLTETNYDLVASPRIATINHKPASILIGSKLGYKTTTVTTTGTVQEIHFLEVGTKLIITPHVSDDEYIRMKIAPKVSEGYVTDDLPTENTTETENEVMVKSGQTIVIGGLTKNKETRTEVGIPLLMNIPLIGNLFKKTNIDNEKRELLVTITPKIMTPEYLEKMQNDITTINDHAKKGSSFLLH